MTSAPNVWQLYALCERTWPPNSTQAGPITIREGKGGGSRVSAATANGSVTTAEIEAAEVSMRALGQTPIFQIRQGEGDLDKTLARRGYQVKDPVVLLAADLSTLDRSDPDPRAAIQSWPPLSIQRQIWKKRGIGPERIAVMERATCNRITLLGRADGRPAGVVYAGVDGNLAMFHALEVLPEFRRRGLARNMILTLAHWARENRADWLSLIVTQANKGALGLYNAMGFETIGAYHYRVLSQEVP